MYIPKYGTPRTRDKGALLSETPKTARDGSEFKDATFQEKTIRIHTGVIHFDSPLQIERRDPYFRSPYKKVHTL